MATALPEAQTSVVEDLLDPAGEPAADEEFVDLDKMVSTEPAATVPAAPAAPAADEDADLAEALRGKSKKEIARMYAEAQSLIGRQGTELGDLRKRADQFITAALAGRQAPAAPVAPAPAAPAAPAVQDDAEFFRQPREAILKEIANSPIIQEIKRTLGERAASDETRRADESTRRFNAAHPDAAEIMSDQEFRNWVGSSRIRTQLLQRAHNNFDFDAGDEVFGTWKALKGAKPVAAAPADAAAAASAAARTLAARKQALNDAATPTSGNAAPAAKSAGKKIYRRADVLRLMEEDPTRYELMADEILAAYADNRVR